MNGVVIGLGRDRCLPIAQFSGIAGTPYWSSVVSFLDVGEPGRAFANEPVGCHLNDCRKRVLTCGLVAAGAVTRNGGVAVYERQRRAHNRKTRPPLSACTRLRRIV